VREQRRIFMGIDPPTGLWLSSVFSQGGKCEGILVPIVRYDERHQLKATLEKLKAPAWWDLHAGVSPTEPHGGRPLHHAWACCSGVTRAMRESDGGGAAGPLLARIGWTTKCHYEVQNLHRKTWGMELKKCRICGKRKLPRGILAAARNEAASHSHGARCQLGLRDICGRCLGLPADKLAARAFAMKARRESGQLTDIARLNALKDQGISL